MLVTLDSLVDTYWMQVNGDDLILLLWSTTATMLGLSKLAEPQGDLDNGLIFAK